ncbi:MAG: Asp-tRNA(Asn)/Glu-tRNA(Gln) amidotransferase subunit GatB [Candidatus Aenigmarchaeota archaeon]|nr:Asp-tRNA(Asn)/Glu-tRNA(Gln) amidotransferase subunit GatB [Candidatus Aenigmarchaeota archaeon]MCX8190953.1 Asp-tRNA(Asn)/Glu-tRNA(Gln) amidotransferase subunit GatB [Candidatus Aenigmarchaeota archaeon]MDW8160252.1 Asp-tRNA(Asn)/Glu-tRNA(Gln) amidotransferase subunit GatB [Candidatus Aenigmarchaeota archaeon]
MNVKIGLEIHCRIETKSKMFCSCPSDVEKARPNEFTCPICLGFPGSKPKANIEAIKKALMIAKALNCKISEVVLFSRKSYFYCDLAKNYQISQFEMPLGRNGYVELSNKKIRIKEIHIEEDPAKLVHVGKSINEAEYVLIDYNRSGIPLVEIVTEPDFSSTKEVREFLSKLSSILEHLGVYDPMKEASMRVDANVSIEGGERIEIKNITGFANVEKALSYEIARQYSLIKTGVKVERETRHWDEKMKATVSLRKKEVEEDYGYIFDPDLVKIETTGLIKEIENRMPELPDERIKRFVRDYGILEEQAKVIILVDKKLADFFEECAKIYKDYRKLARWVVVDLLKCLNWNNIRIGQSKVEKEKFVKLLEMIDRKVITERLAKEIIKEFVATGKDPEKIVEEKGLQPVGKEDIENVVELVLKENQKAVEDYMNGNEVALNFLVGVALKKLKTRGDPKLIKSLLIEKIKSLNS